MTEKPGIYDDELCQVTIHQNDGILRKLTSFPSGIPAPRVAVRAIIFAIPVRNVKYSFKTTPRRIVFISGIPEPGYDIIKKILKNRSRVSSIK